MIINLRGEVIIMLWEELREYQFKGAIRDFEGICVVPYGNLEKKGQHLPVGTYGLVVDAVLEEATKIEDVVIFPTGYWVGETSAPAMAKPTGEPIWRGAIELSVELQMTILEELFDEIGRNGFNKIVFLTRQPAGTTTRGLFLRKLEYEKRNYACFTISAINEETSKPENLLKTIKERKSDFNMVTDSDIKTLEKWVADGLGEDLSYVDTAIMLAKHEEYVKCDRINAEIAPEVHLTDIYDEDGVCFANMENIKYPNIKTPVVPDGLTKTIGEALLKVNAECMAKAFKLLKEDERCLHLGLGIRNV